MNKIIVMLLLPLIKKYLDGKISSEQIQLLVKSLIDKFITKENIDRAIDGILDVVENMAKKTDTTIDDEILAEIRKLTNVPDNDKIEVKPEEPKTNGN